MPPTEFSVEGIFHSYSANKAYSYFEFEMLDERKYVEMNRND